MTEASDSIYSDQNRDNSDLLNLYEDYSPSPINQFFSQGDKRFSIQSPTEESIQGTMDYQDWLELDISQEMANQDRLELDIFQEMANQDELELDISQEMRRNSSEIPSRTNRSPNSTEELIEVPNQSLNSSLKKEKPKKKIQSQRYQNIENSEYLSNRRHRKNSPKSGLKGIQMKGFLAPFERFLMQGLEPKMKSQDFQKMKKSYKDQRKQVGMSMEDYTRLVNIEQVKEPLKELFQTQYFEERFKNAPKMTENNKEIFIKKIPLFERALRKGKLSRMTYKSWKAEDLSDQEAESEKLKQEREKKKKLKLEKQKKIYKPVPEDYK